MVMTIIVISNYMVYTSYCYHTVTCQQLGISWCFVNFLCDWWFYIWKHW